MHSFKTILVIRDFAGARYESDDRSDGKASTTVSRSRCGLTVTAILMTGLLAVSPRVQAEPLIEVTREVFAKVRSMAQEARDKHSTSHTDAAQEFNDLFEAEFGEVMPKEAVIMLTDGVGVLLHTPISTLRDSVEYALLKDEPIPEMPLKALVIVSVHPRQMLTPNVRQVVLYRGTQKVAPLENDFGLKEYSTRSGGKSLVGAGTIAFPFSAFAPGAEVRLVLTTDGKPIEWRWRADAQSALK
jgi:hypothetical protein